MRIIFEKKDLLRALSAQLGSAVQDVVLVQADPLELELLGMEYEPDQENAEKMVQAGVAAPVAPPSKKEEDDDGTPPSLLLKRSRNLLQELAQNGNARPPAVEDDEF